uniref:OTU domain-containing protein n=1 Tax=Salix viminalis TaxID=40686 RepID=A0A6N2N7D3_SALVM
MVKTKQQKSKPKKTPHVKKQGKQANIVQFRVQLDALGLKIVQVTADGNCFFRGLADQLEGNEEEHGKYRSMVVQYITKTREMFEPFIEDDVPFDEYCQLMEKDGTWAGHMELQAASLVTHSNICVHRYMSPRWYIRNFDQHGARMVHLSYHDEEHYNSVRSKDDPCNGPAQSIIIKVDADLSATSAQAKAVSCKSKAGIAKDSFESGSLKLVMAGSGCENAEKVKQVLLEVDGDVDAAIEFLIAEQETDSFSEENNSLCYDTNFSNECQGDGVDGNCEQYKEELVTETNKQKIPRNKDCSCGSKKKHKAYCGAVKGRSSTKIVDRTVDFRKGRKETKHSKKGHAESVPSSGSDGWLPDMGALCRPGSTN